MAGSEARLDAQILSRRSAQISERMLRAMNTNVVGAAEAAGIRYETKGETALRLRVSVRTIENWVRYGIIPMGKIGRRCLFDPGAVDRALSVRTINGGF